MKRLLLFIALGLIAQFMNAQNAPASTYQGPIIIDKPAPGGIGLVVEGGKTWLHNDDNGDYSSVLELGVLKNSKDPSIKIYSWDSGAQNGMRFVAEREGAGFGWSRNSAHGLQRISSFGGDDSYGQYLRLYGNSPDNASDLKVLLRTKGDSYISSNGNFGLGTDAPTEKLDVNGKARIRDLPNGGDFVVTTDVNGNLKKVGFANLPVIIGGDNLGNHNATMNLNMGGNNIVNAFNIFAGNNVNAVNDIVAGRDVTAGRNIFAVNNIEAGFDVIAGNDVDAVFNVNAGQDVNALRDVRADIDVIAGRNVFAVNNVNAGFDVNAGNDVDAAYNVNAGQDMNALGDVNAGRNVIASNKIGIKLNNPTTELDVNGKARIRNLPNGGIFVVTADQNGNLKSKNFGELGAILQDLGLSGPPGPAGADGAPGNTGPAGPPGESDNLGNHCATNDLDMKEKRIRNVCPPLLEFDAATKGYVDELLNGANKTNPDLISLINDLKAEITTLKTRIENLENQ